MAEMIGAAFIKFGRAPTMIMIFILDSSPPSSRDFGRAIKSKARAAGKCVEQPAQFVRPTFKAYAQLIGGLLWFALAAKAEECFDLLLRSHRRIEYTSPDQSGRSILHFKVQFISRIDPTQAVKNRTAVIGLSGIPERQQRHGS